MNIQVFIAGRSEGEYLSDSLRALTKAICDADPDQDGSGGLGGDYGYGCNYENDVFEMRRFYWGDCTCGADDTDSEPHKPTCAFNLPNFKHKRTGNQVNWYKWIGRDNEVSGDADWAEIMAECLKSVHPKG